MRTGPAILVVGLILSSGLALRAQVPAAADFEVASVKRNASGDRRAARDLQGDRFVLTNQPLLSIISLAFEIPLYRIDGAPSWLATGRYDINARTTPNQPPREKWRLMRRLLETRFRLATSVHTREGDVLRLERVSADRLGPQMVASGRTDCDEVIAARHAGTVATAPPAPGELPACGAAGGPTGFRAQGIRMTEFADSLSAMLQQPVVDATDLPGRFDLRFESSGLILSPAASAAGRPSIFTALQEQLGLRLIAGRGTVNVLRIDHIEEAEAD